MQQLNHNSSYQSIAVIGAGAWGTALAIVASQNVKQVYLYDRDKSIVDTINNIHQNSKYLPDITLAKNIISINSPDKLAEVKLILVVVPAQAVRPVLEDLKKYILKQIPILICCKGIENNTLELMSNISKQILPNNPVAVLSGPNFASEVATNKIAATAIACESDEIGTKILNTLATKSFRTYLSNDVIGVQIGGGAKNVIAIAAGMVESLKLGENAKAALITRGLSEITKISLKLGGKLETMLGLAGVGDLLLTCGTTTSRNMRLGFKLGSGEKVADILKTSTTCEGYFTTLSIHQLSEKLALDLPISNAVYNILYNHSEIKTEIEKLMNRPLKAEAII